MVETLVGRICALAQTQPEKLAVAFKKEQLTYGELKNRMVQVAGRMQALGVQPGDRVPFSATSKPEMAAVYLGIQYLGAVAVFVDKNASIDTTLFIYRDIGAKILFTDKPLRGHESECSTYSLRRLFSEPCERAAAYSRPADGALAEIIYTSGTTGQLKGCMLTYRAVCSIWSHTIKGGGMLRADDRLLLPLPLNHSFALRMLRAALYLGASVILQNGFTFAREIEVNLDTYHCTAIAIVPASVETITRQMQGKFAEIMGRFRYIEVSAGSLSLEQRKRLTRQLPHTVLVNSWGSSESGGALFLNVTQEARNGEKLAALGKPVEGVAVETRDASGRAFVSSREHPGRLALQGDMLMAGYWNRPALTEQVLRGGWLLTGDLVYLDADGYLYLLGRADDLINVGGEKVSPVEVENAAGAFEGVSECACIGVPDPEGILGSVPVLFVAAKGGAYDEDALKRFLSAKLEKYKLPARYVEVLAIPRNAMQKTDRKALKALWENQGKQKLLNETIHTIMTRRSVRKFTQQPIPRDVLESILTAGYYAPSGHNMQTWRFTVLTNRAELQRLREATRLAAQSKGVYFYGWENPVALVLVSNDKRNPYGCQDASCAAENLMLAAKSYGIGSVWLNPLMTLRDVEPVKALLDAYEVPAGHTVWSAVALGYPAAEGPLLQKKADVIRWID